MRNRPIGGVRDEEGWRDSRNMTENSRNTEVGTCRFWSCHERIRREHHYCLYHYRPYQQGGVDDCPSCGRAKNIKYKMCLDCEQTGSSEEHSDEWEGKDAEAYQFYVYILKLDGGSFYAYQTYEIRERMMEHRDGTTKSTAGRNPKLVWFTTISTRQRAEELEADLEELCDKNPREIRRRVRRLQDLVDELDFS